MKKTTRPIWIAVTGLDGAGKTTLVDNLETWLKDEKNLSVKRDRLPHDTYIVKTLLDKSKDRYTDRLLFAVDNRLFGTELKDIIKYNECDVILTQRCFLDSFVHGAVQGYSYSWIEELNQVNDLPKTDILIHMVAECNIAYSRICDDPEADKFEYPSYMRKQEIETRRIYSEILSGKDSSLNSFANAKNIYVDTTQMVTEEVFEFVKHKLEILNIF